jgi:hypothetical protein
MASRRMDVAPPHSIAGLRCLTAVLIAGLGTVACASATVSDNGVHDGAATGGAGGGAGGGGKGGSGGAGGSGGTSTSSSGLCDPFTNSGCPSDKKCTALQVGSALTLGCGSKGSGAEGNICTRSLSGADQSGDDCGDGLACFALSGEPSATCRRICPTSGTAHACPSGELCSLVVGGLNGLAFCRKVVTCQPLEQTGCASGEGCYFSTSGSYTGSLCAKAGTKKPGDACTVANECEPGATCLIVGAGVCSSFCSTADGGSPSCSGASTGGSTFAALGGSSDEPNLGSCRNPG